MSFRSCSTIPVRTGRRCCRSSRPCSGNASPADATEARSDRTTARRAACRSDSRTAAQARPDTSAADGEDPHGAARIIPAATPGTTRTPRHRRKPIPGRGRPAGTDHRGRPHVAGGVRSPAPQPFTQAKATAQTDYFTLNEQAGTFIPACC